MYKRKTLLEVRKINKKEDRKSKCDSLDKFVSILRECVENEYYEGFEGKIEKGKIVDSKDLRRRKYKNDGKKYISMYHRNTI